MPGEGFLGAIEPAARARLEAALTVRGFSRGAFVITQDDPTDDVYIVLRGRARATIYSRDGKMVAYRDMEPGAIFGELSAIDGTPRSTSVIAREDLTVGCLSGSAFRRLIESDPAAMWALVRYLVRQSRRMTERIFEFSTMLVKDRLVQELVRLARAASPAGNTAVLSPAPTHFEIAAQISTHREAVSREMSRLARRRLVRKTPQGLYVTDIAALEAMARGGDAR